MLFFRATEQLCAELEGAILLGRFAARRPAAVRFHFLKGRRESRVQIADELVAHRHRMHDHASTCGGPLPRRAAPRAISATPSMNRRK